MKVFCLVQKLTWNKRFGYGSVRMNKCLRYYGNDTTIVYLYIYIYNNILVQHYISISVYKYIHSCQFKSKLLS